MDTVIEMKNIRKEFTNVLALDNVDFSVSRGEVHALIGENGAGKSTLMSILFGVFEKDQGEILINGENTKISDASKAIELGIGMVHQEFMLSQEMTVLENIILGFEPQNKSVIDYKQAYGKINKLSKKYNLEVNPEQRVINISVGQAQRVEILKSLYRGVEYLIMDEPTAVLTPQETKELFNIIRSLKEDGKTIIFISHKLDEVMEIADRMTILRNGKVIDTITNQEASKKKLANLMVGRDVFLDFSPEEVETGDKILELKNVSARGKRELSHLDDISLEVKKGEILGIAGVDGNGQSELVEVISGLRDIDTGEIYLNNE
ncbi:MAG: ABC transporter ATP-binding protein, partial [Halanaerobiaceae bacterium]